MLEGLEGEVVEDKKAEGSEHQTERKLSEPLGWNEEEPDISLESEDEEKPEVKTPGEEGSSGGGGWGDLM